MTGARKHITVDLGPIRPPSEAMSLLVRVSRNCPWNKCVFCPVYKNEKFERRDVGEVLAEIDRMALAAEEVTRRAAAGVEKGAVAPKDYIPVLQDPESTELEKRIAMWLYRGGKHVFLQDADSLIAPVHRIEPVLGHLKMRFPAVDRVTTYARSRTLAAKTASQLKSLRAAGLTRIHVGVESGSAEVLDLVSKGCKPSHHEQGCTRAISAGFEVCCYVMPGLGGRALSSQHAEETGKLLRRIDPHHIRLRSLYVLPGSPLDGMRKDGAFECVEEDRTIVEIRTMLRALKGARSKVVSDHDFNLLMKIEGHVTDDAMHLEKICTDFLNLPQKTRDGFILARRGGYFRSLAHFLADPSAVASFTDEARALREAGGGSLVKGMEAKLRIRSI